MWTKRHSGIYGNETVDKAAKVARACTNLLKIPLKIIFRWIVIPT